MDFYSGIDELEEFFNAQSF